MKIILLLFCVIAELCSAGLEEDHSSNLLDKPSFLLGVESLLDTAPEDLSFTGWNFVLKESALKSKLASKRLLKMEQCQPLLLKSGSSESLELFYELIQKAASFYKIQVGRWDVNYRTTSLLPVMVTSRPDSKEAKADQLVYTAFSMSAVSLIFEGKAKEEMLHLLGKHLLKLSNDCMNYDLKTVQNSLAISYDRVFEKQPALGVDQTLLGFLQEYASEMFRFLRPNGSESSLEAFNYEDAQDIKLYKTGWEHFMKKLYVPTTEEGAPNHENPAMLFKDSPRHEMFLARRNHAVKHVRSFTLDERVSAAGQFLYHYIVPIVYACRVLKSMDQFQHDRTYVTVQERKVHVSLYRTLHEIYDDSPQEVKDVAKGKLTLPPGYAKELNDRFESMCVRSVTVEGSSNQLDVCERSAVHDYLREVIPNFAYIFEHIQQSALQGGVLETHPMGLNTIRPLNFSMLSVPATIFAYLKGNGLLIIRLTQLSLTHDRFIPVLKDVLETQNDFLALKSTQLTGKTQLKEWHKKALSRCNEALEDLNENSEWQSSPLTWAECKKKIASVSSKYSSLWGSIKYSSKFNWDCCEEEVEAFCMLWRLGKKVRSSAITQLLINVVCDTKFALEAHGQKKLGAVLETCAPYTVDGSEMPPLWSPLGVDDFLNFAYQFSENAERIACLSECVNIVQKISWSNPYVFSKILKVMLAELEALLAVPDQLKDSGLACSRYLHALAVIVRSWREGFYVISFAPEISLYKFKERQMILPHIIQEHFPKVLAWHQQIFKAYGLQLSTKFDIKVDHFGGIDLPTIAQAIHESLKQASFPVSKKQSIERLLEKVEGALKLLNQISHKESMLPDPRDVLHSELIKSWWDPESESFQYLDWELKRLIKVILDYPAFMQECLDECCRILGDTERVMQIIQQAISESEATLIVRFEPSCNIETTNPLACMRYFPAYSHAESNN